MAEAKRFKDTEKIPHIEGNEFANTFYKSPWQPAMFFCFSFCLSLLYDGTL
jgi:hypothetical protein